MDWLNVAPKILGAATVAFAAAAALTSDLRRSTTSLWLAGLMAGAFYLSLGAEYLAVIQWILSTVVSIAFVFFSVMFGEVHHKTESEESFADGTKSAKGSLPPIGRRRAGFFGRLMRQMSWKSYAALCPAAVFFVMAVFHFDPKVAREESVNSFFRNANLATLGKALSSQHLVSLDLLALIFFVVLLGAGVIARPRETLPVDDRIGRADDGASGGQ
jgi:NADH:ubiquinone oxidoreductase subunit 6 (subunit J)